MIAFVKLWYAARLSIMPSLTAAALLCVGTAASTQYSEFSAYILNFWRKSYFLEVDLLVNTVSWFVKVVMFGFIVSILILLHARNQEVALAKFREFDEKHK
jgi:hypothetical protein